MLDDEKDKRAQLSVTFQEKMKNISAEINTNKEEREALHKENEDIRAKINSAIDQYKVKQEEYQNSLNKYNERVAELQNELDKQLKEGKIGQVVNAHEKAKNNYEAAILRVDRISTSIQDFSNKFDKIKDEVVERSKRFESLKMEKENKDIQIKLLETEIQNILLKT
jgi:chromosome segregation ATPase